MALGAIFPGRAGDGRALFHQQHIGALARIDRLFGVARAERRRARIVSEIAFEQIGMARRHLPKKRQHALVGKKRFPRRLEEPRRAHRRRATEGVGEHPFPRIELEQGLDHAAIAIIETRVLQPDVAHVQQRGATTRLRRAIGEIGGRAEILHAPAHRGEMHEGAGRDLRPARDEPFMQGIELVASSGSAPCATSCSSQCHCTTADS